MKKLLALLLLVPIISIGQTFSSSSVIECNVNEYGVHSYGERVKGENIIIIEKDIISINTAHKDPIFLEIESIKRSSTMIHYYIKSYNNSTIVYYDNVKTIFLSVFSCDNSGTIFIFENCKIIK